MKRIIFMILILLGSSSITAQTNNYKNGIQMQDYLYPVVCLNNKKYKPPLPRYAKHRAKTRKRFIKSSNKRFKKRMRDQRRALRELNRVSSKSIFIR